MSGYLAELSRFRTAPRRFGCSFFSCNIPTVPFDINLVISYGPVRSGPVACIRVLYGPVLFHSRLCSTGCGTQPIPKWDRAGLKRSGSRDHGYRHRLLIQVGSSRCPDKTALSRSGPCTRTVLEPCKNSLTTWYRSYVLCPKVHNRFLVFVFKHS